MKWSPNLPPDLILIVGADAASVVEQRAGERGRLSAVWTEAAQVQRLLPVDHAVWETGGRRQVRTVGPCSSCVGGGGGEGRGRVSRRQRARDLRQIRTRVLILTQQQQQSAPASLQSRRPNRQKQRAYLLDAGCSLPTSAPPLCVHANSHTHTHK